MGASAASRTSGGVTTTSRIGPAARCGPRLPTVSVSAAGWPVATAGRSVVPYRAVTGALDGPPTDVDGLVTTTDGQPRLSATCWSTSGEPGSGSTVAVPNVSPAAAPSATTTRSSQ